MAHKQTMEGDMGLLDVLNGMQNGPRGPSTPGKGGMSPITMAILALLAYKAIGKMGGQAQASPQPNPQRDPRLNPAPAPGGGLGGGLGGLGGMLGGLLAGGAAGSILSGGLNDLLKQFQQAGQGDAARSWVGTGPNQDISENDLAKALGNDQIRTMMQQSGLSQDDLLAGLRQALPGVIDQLTPQGRIPSGDELSRMI
jgi:uncharacterized protein YidB (DUF937 family)